MNKILKNFDLSKPIKCTEENWINSWVCSENTLKNVIQYIKKHDNILDVDVCEDGGFHIWTDTIALAMQVETNEKLC